MPTRKGPTIAQLRAFTPAELHAEITARLSRRGIQPTGHAEPCPCEPCRAYQRRCNAVYSGLQSAIGKPSGWPVR